MYMYMYTHICGRGRDERGRRRSAAIPPDELPRENVGKMLEMLTMYYKMWQRVHT